MPHTGICRRRTGPLRGGPAVDADGPRRQHSTDLGRGGAPVALRNLPRGATVTTRRGEHGSITPLIIGFTLLVAVLVAVVVDASAAYLRRQGLNSVADAAALAATDGLQGDAVYTHGLADHAEIDPAAARRYVEDYLRSSEALARYPGMTWAVSTSATAV